MLYLKQAGRLLRGSVIAGHLGSSSSSGRHALIQGPAFDRGCLSATVCVRAASMQPRAAPYSTWCAAGSSSTSPTIEADRSGVLNGTGGLRLRYYFSTPVVSLLRQVSVQVRASTVEPYSKTYVLHGVDFVPGNRRGAAQGRRGGRMHGVVSACAPCVLPGTASCTPGAILLHAPQPQGRKWKFFWTGQLAAGCLWP